MKETLKIAFGDLKNRDVQRNDLTDKSSKKIVSSDEILGLAAQSFFRNVYQQALEQISMIVQQNHEQVSDQTNDQLYKHDIQNIIAFTGRRGTGKTSAMMSLAEFLSNHELEIKNSTVKETINATVAFKLLAEIDATSLDENVSLIPAILSQIITRLNEELYCSNCGRKYSETEKNTFQEIYKTANQLFTDYITGIHTSSKAIDASNYLSIASKRLSFEKSFRDLIRNYAENFFKNKNSYFIICIDDVDMAPCNHAELLISIHKYLMIPNIIVMLTANLKFLAPEVQTLFYKNAIPANDTLAVDRLSTEQTEEYLKKIIPSDNRITLPSWKKKDYLSIFPIKISFYDVPVKKESVEEIKLLYNKLVKSEFFDFIDKQSKKEKPEPFSITPKELILMMIANRTKVYLDVCGMKYHFFEPSSLRNMYDLFYILYNMNNIVEEYDDREKNSYYLHRSQNRKRLLDYIHFTMRRDYRFDAQTSEFLDELIAYPIERRGQKIWGYYYQLLDSEGIRQRIDSAYGTGFRLCEKYFFRTEKYSFGEFLRILYTSSRIGVFDHKFIKFILASYSMALPAFVENEKRKRDQENGHYKQLVALFGSSLIGTTWCDELFGCTLEARTILHGYQYNPLYDKIDTNYDYKANRCSIEIPIHQKKIVDILELEKLISLLLLSPRWVTEAPIEVKKNNDKWIIDAELDPTSFLINCLLINEKIRDIHDTKTHNKTAEIFKYNNQTLTLSGLIMTIYQGFDLSSKDYCELKVTDENGKDVYIINRNADKPESIKENSIPKDYINAYHDLIIQIDNDGDHKIDDTFTIPLRDDKDNPITNEKGVQIKGKGTIVDIILDYLVQDYRAHHLANMLKHIDLIYNTIKRTITDIVYITSHDVVKKKKRFENAGEPAFIIADFYTKLIKQLKDTDKVYFAKGTEADYSFATRFETCAVVKNICSMKKEKDAISLICTEINPNELGETDFKDETTPELNTGGDAANEKGKRTLRLVTSNIARELFTTDDKLEALYSIFMASLMGHLITLSDHELTESQSDLVTNSIISYLTELSAATRNRKKVFEDILNKAYLEIKRIIEEE